MPGNGQDHCCKDYRLMDGVRLPGLSDFTVLLNNLFVMDHLISRFSPGKWLLFVLTLLLTQFCYGQVTIVKGVVIDADTKDPIAGASVFFQGGKGVNADSSGHFEINTSRNYGKIIVSYVGYKSKTVTIQVGKTQMIEVSLNLDESKNLNSVVIKTKKKVKYTNRNNPAVELIRHVIDNRDKNKPEFYNYVEYEQYEKLQLSLNRKGDILPKTKLLKPFNFIFENADSTKVPGKTLVPVYLEEKLSQQYFRKNPEKNKNVMLDQRRVNFGDYVDSAGISAYLNRLYENVDIYQSSVSLFTRDFLSPIANMAPSFYMYFIRDTVTDAAGTKLVRMYFTPRNTNDFLFRGIMFITLDSNYAVQKLNMTVSPNINLNLVREMYINQEFERNPSDGKYHVIKSNIITELSLSKDKEKNGLFGERTVSYRNYQINVARDDAFYKAQAAVVPDFTRLSRDSFWASRRHDTLSVAEATTYKNIDSLRSMSAYKRIVAVANLFLSGYTPIGKFEVGPAAAFYAWNPVEGFRLRFGGRSTPKLSKRIYFEGYGAYGFKDEQWKGYLGITYSLNNKSIYSFPLRYVRISAQRETQIPGQELAFVQEDNLLLSFKRGRNDKWLYNNLYKANYIHEMKSRFSYGIGLRYWKQQPAGGIQYVKQPNGIPVRDPHLVTTDVSLMLRWAPKEQFYQGLVYRVPIINRYPIFTFNYVKGIKGPFNSQYNYDNLSLAIQKRIYMTTFGNMDVLLEGGYIFGKLPYPLLTVHRANQTYALQLNSYNLMNFLEFVSDRFVALNLDHNFNGFLFNRVPLLRKLQLREVISAKAIMGGVREENDPAKNPDLYLFPQINGRNSTFTLNKEPYIEGSVGVSNIFRILRLDVIKRFTHLDNPDIPKWGIRGRMRFEF